MEKTAYKLVTLMLAMGIAAGSYAASVEAAGGSTIVTVAAAQGPDSDTDGLPDDVENLLKTDPQDFDTDGDGIDDGYEVVVAMDALDAADADLDIDADGLTNYEEYVSGSSIYDRDTDNDAWADGLEVLRGTDPADAANFPVSNVFADIDADGRANAVDVQIVINAALGQTTDAPANVDGVDGVNAIDVQLTINAALGVR